MKFRLISERDDSGRNLTYIHYIEGSYPTVQNALKKVGERAIEDYKNLNETILAKEEGLAKITVEFEVKRK